LAERAQALRGLHAQYSVRLLPRSADPIWHGRARPNSGKRRLTAATTRATCPFASVLPDIFYYHHSRASARPVLAPQSRDQPPWIGNLRPLSATAPGDVDHLAVMPALLVDTNPRPASSSDASSTSERSRRRSESASPNRPPVSPITPRASVAQLAPVERTEAPRPAPPPAATFRQQPAPVAISESENPDVIALRSAISLLQLQREKSKRDLRALAELKSVAVADPKGFAQSIQENRPQATQSRNDILGPTLAGLADSVPSDGANVNTGQSGVDMRKDSADVGTPTSASKFPAIPQPQNVVRCPPINWAKYHVVGESLNKLHEEQKKWPGQPEPPRTQSGARAPPHAVAAPYSPFTDGIGGKRCSAPQPPKSSKKSPA
jgi:hypothetical protein